MEGGCFEFVCMVQDAMVTLQATVPIVDAGDSRGGRISEAVGAIV